MNKSFTLIEILVVIVVIGVLSAFILIGMSSITNSANIAKGQAFANSIRNSLLLNLVSEWKLNGNTNDSWGTNNGTWSGATAPNTVVTYGSASECVSGQCLDFDGVDDMVDAGNNSTLSMGTNDHTVSFWVKHDSGDNSYGEYEVYLVCGATADGLGQDGYYIARGPGEGFRITFSDGLVSRVQGEPSTNPSLATDKWLHIVVVFDRDTLATIYINSILQSSTLNISGQATSVNNTYSYRIGSAASGSLRLRGKMDEISMYHAAKPSSSIKQEYYFGLNKLFNNNGIGLEEYSQRLVELKNNLANN